MIFRRERVELTAAERRLYKSLRQDVDVDPVHEDRTVAALRAAGVFDAPSRTPWRPARVARRRVTTIAAVAACVVAIVGTSTLLDKRRNTSLQSSLDSAGLATIGSTAPFVGLFGTVFGIINAFSAMGDAGQAGIGAVASGISEALFTTALGLLVAVPAVWLFNYFTGKVDGFIVEMDNSASELVDYFIKNRTKQLKP